MDKDDLSNVDVVVYALLLLGGHERKVHTEEVAYKAYELAPERFGWRLRKFRAMGFPDKSIVRFALEDAAKQRYGALTEGRSGSEATGKDSDGWRLTASGARWVREHEEHIRGVLGLAHAAIAPKEAARFCKQVKDQPMFAALRRNEPIAPDGTRSLTDMLNVSPDAPTDIIRRKFDRLRATAALVADSQIMEFLARCEKEFAPILSETDASKEKLE